MAPVLPIAKLVELVVKQIAKPVSMQFLKSAASNPERRRRFIAVGQMLHRMNVRVTLLADGQFRPPHISAIPDEQALSAGTVIVGEVLVFGISGFILVEEYYRAQLKTKKEADLQNRLAMMKTVMLQEQQIERDRRLAVVESHSELTSRSLTDLRGGLTLLTDEVRELKHLLRSRADLRGGGSTQYHSPPGDPHSSQESSGAYEEGNDAHANIHRGVERLAPTLMEAPRSSMPWIDDMIANSLKT